MKIANNTVVTLNYHLHAGKTDQAKTHIESTDANHPFVFLFGGGNLIPGFEENLIGKTIGDKFEFSIEPDKAYGEVDKNAIMDLPIDIFKVDNVIDFSALKTGNILPMSDNEGNQMQGKVVSYNDTTVTMDFNHVLAGQTLHFSGEVIGVRSASPEEIAHKHVH